MLQIAIHCEQVLREDFFSAIWSRKHLARSWRISSRIENLFMQIGSILQTSMWFLLTPIDSYCERWERFQQMINIYYSDVLLTDRIFLRRWKYLYWNDKKPSICIDYQAWDYSLSSFGWIKIYTQHKTLTVLKYVKMVESSLEISRRMCLNKRTAIKIN